MKSSASRRTSFSDESERIVKRLTSHPAGGSRIITESVTTRAADLRPLCQLGDCALRKLPESEPSRAATKIARAQGKNSGRPAGVARDPPAHAPAGPASDS